jgi:hypothetical protein
LSDTSQLDALAKELRLTKAQRVFAEGVAAGKTQRQAATDAGSKSPDYLGTRWSKSVKVQKYLKALTQAAITKADKATNGTVRNLAKVVEHLWEEAEETRPAEIVKGYDESGAYVPKLARFRPQAARIALLDYYTPKKDAPTINNNMIVLPPEMAVELFTRRLKGTLPPTNGHGTV